MTIARFRFFLVIFLIAAVGPTAFAQDSTTGAVRGVVSDTATGGPAIGATVVATSPELLGQRTEITDETGSYYLSNLPSGTYLLTVHYLDSKIVRSNVLVRLGQVSRVNVRFDTSKAAGETIQVEGRAPIIDQQSTKNSKTIDSSYARNLPTGRAYSTVLAGVPGSLGDAKGTSFGGSTSTENSFVVDGLNVTDPVFAIVRAPLPTDFIRETEVIQGGYSAEFGRATGALVNVVTKSGSNEFHGSIFGYWTPGALSRERVRVPSAASSIASERNLDHEFDFGAELGGPLLKDRLWFHVGVNPVFDTINVDRVIYRRFDDDQDGIADLDENGFIRVTELDRTTRIETVQNYYYSAKITGAVAPEHQGVMSISGSPRTGDFVSSVVGPEEANTVTITSVVIDSVAKWMSKFNGGKTQIDALLGYHWDKRNVGPTFEEGGGNSVVYGTTRPLTDYMAYEGFVPNGCNDMSASDPYPRISNCPVRSYRVGGYGFYEEPLRTRLSGRLDYTQRVVAAGHHEIKVGGDFEDQAYEQIEGLSGGTLYSQQTDGRWLLTRYLGYADGGDVPCGADIDGDGVADGRCTRLDEVASTTNTLNLSAYARDSWSVLPNLTFNAGVRWEQQTLYAAEELAGTTSSVTGEPIPEVAFKLSNMIAPRVGVIYDPTEEGRSRIYTHWGRFYESVPMGLNFASFGGTSSQRTYLAPTACDRADPVATCDESSPVQQQVLGGSEGLVAPGMRGQYVDEMIIGGEYELLPDLKVGAAYIRRDLGRVIEDMSTDGGGTYVFGNPGEVDGSAVDGMRDDAMQMRATGNEAGAAAKEYLADQFEAVAGFDKPIRTYNAIQITADRRFTDRFYVSGSYTYARLRGNHPGLFETDTGSGIANITALYDFPDILANRYGPLPGDRPHLIKLDSFYRLPVGPASILTFGGQFRAQSGPPMTVRGSHPIYGSTFILPRGREVTYIDDDGRHRTLGRGSMTTGVDTHIAYGHKLRDDLIIEGFVDIMNVFNQQQAATYDQTYTADRVNPIVGGDSEDLLHAKKIVNGQSGPQTVERYPNFGNPASRLDPTSLRFGLRLTF